MLLENSTIQVLVIEEIFNMFRNRKLRKGSTRECKRELIKKALSEKQKAGSLEVFEKILWDASRYEEYKHQVQYVKNTFQDLRRKAGFGLRKLIKTPK